LESVCRGNSTEGSNPSLSANIDRSLSGSCSGNQVSAGNESVYSSLGREFNAL
jgi:hypothetical protein